MDTGQSRKNIFLGPHWPTDFHFATTELQPPRDMGGGVEGAMGLQDMHLLGAADKAIW